VRRRRRGRRVVTPDGYVWFVRRRRARRRPFWSSRGRYPERFHNEDELPDPDEETPLPGPIDMFTDDGEHLGDRLYDDQTTVATTILLGSLLLVVIGALAWVTGTYVVPFLTANARPLLATSAVLAVLATLNQLHRPWYVELQRQGLAGAPRRVWRVQGWRRSGRLIAALTAAVREGRIDHRGAVILPADDRR
jgi:hypothetical protein